MVFIKVVNKKNLYSLCTDDNIIIYFLKYWNLYTSKLDTTISKVHIQYRLMYLFCELRSDRNLIRVNKAGF